MTSTEKLVVALREANASPEFIADAEQFRYDEYRSTQEDAPILALIYRLEHEGLVGLAARAIGGEFDASTEEARAWAESEEGYAILSMLPGPLRRSLLTFDPAEGET